MGSKRITLKYFSVLFIYKIRRTMDISTLYMLLLVASGLFLVSLFCAVTDRENMITVMCMCFSGIIYWACSNVYLSGNLVRTNVATGLPEVLQDGTASSVLFYIGLLVLAGFVLQIYKVFSSSGAIEEMGE